MAFTKRIKELKESQCDKGVLTIYLNTLRSGQDDWKLQLKNGLKKLEQYVMARKDKEELKSFRDVKKKVTKQLMERQHDMLKAVVIFASPDQNIWEFHHLQLSVENSFCWEKEPVLDQLEAIQQHYPAAGVLVLQQMDLLALDTRLGEVTQQIRYTLNIEDDNWRKYEGTAAGERVASSANHKDQYQERLEVNQQRWLRRLAPLIDRKSKECQWQGVYIVGSQELAKELGKYLQTKIIRVIPKNLASLPSHRVVGEVIG
ncbi:MAG: VLRF1 family aeRF1-type release factor [Bacillaceae bacterium]|nr:VLRF1 family aeRF1-type release factor [Bacillaceae bacterium]